MRVLLAVVVTVILGVVTGITAAVLQLKLSPWDGDPGGQGRDPRMPQMADAGEPVPRVVVLDSEEYDFGRMDFEDKRSHDFLIKNTGEATLVLTMGDTTCRCTGAEIDQSDVLPGKSTKVTVTWEADEKVGPYRASATIFTNDPRRDRVTLTVSGRITAITRAAPPKLVFSTVPAGQSVVGKVHLYGYLDEPLEIRGFDLSDPTTAEQFGVTFEPLPSDQLEEEPEARSGYLVEIAVKPGLPMGPFQQRILVHTNLEAAPEVEIPVVGRVVSDILVVDPGHGWDGVLGLGVVNSQQGAQRRLLLVVSGPYRQQVQFSDVRTTPEWLQVKLGEKTPINDGAVFQTPLTIQVPKDRRPANYLGSEQGELGEILISTNHPQVRQLRIGVRFAIEE